MNTSFTLSGTNILLPILFSNTSNLLIVIDVLDLVQLFPPSGEGKDTYSVASLTNS
jgi:hypothetical protein